MDLNSMLDAFDRVTKRQKVYHSIAQSVIEQICDESKKTLNQMQSIVDGMPQIQESESVLPQLKLKVDSLTPFHQLLGLQKELNLNLTKFVKLLEKLLNPHISRVCRNIDLDLHLMNQMIANDFYRQGLFDLGDSLINEASQEEDTKLRSHFLEIYQISESLKLKNVEPALKWISANREKLKDNGSKLELKLISRKYCDILKKGNRSEALQYARTHFLPFTSDHMNEVQKLMACLLWSGSLENSPYSDMISPSIWEKLAKEITQQYYLLLDQPYNSPLTVALSAGLESLPTLLKLAHVMALKKQEWQAMKQLPVPLELGNEFQFHSIFVCPVSRDQSSDENPPMLMPCFHVLCKQSIMKLAKDITTCKFKCPYCPLQTSPADCRQLYF